MQPAIGKISPAGFILLDLRRRYGAEIPIIIVSIKKHRNAGKIPHVRDLRERPAYDMLEIGNLFLPPSISCIHTIYLVYIQLSY